MACSKFNKALHTEITKLKLLDAYPPPQKFSIDSSPFSEDDEGGFSLLDKGKIAIVGRIFPVSEIYKESAFQIEMKLPTDYPANAPSVHFLTKIYHPNVAEDGQFCHDILKLTAGWTPRTSLVDVVKAVVDLIDHPELESAIRPIVASEYQHERQNFNRLALQMVTKNTLPRN